MRQWEGHDNKDIGKEKDEAADKKEKKKKEKGSLGKDASPHRKWRKNETLDRKIRAT